MSEYSQQIKEMVNELCDAYTQKSLSSLVGVPQGTLSKIKNGKLENFSFKKADAIRSFYLTWKQKTPAGQS